MGNDLDLTQPTNPHGERPTRVDLNQTADEDVSPTAVTRRHVSRVLIIEETQELAQSIQAALDKLAILAFHERDGAKAIQQYRRYRADLVILNLSLPGLAGWAALDAFKEMKSAFSRPAIVVITPYDAPANRLMGRLQGVDAHLVKPFEIDRLCEAVQELLGKRGQSARV